MSRRTGRPAHRPTSGTTALATVDLDELGRLAGPGGRPVPNVRLAEHLAHTLRVPHWATDIYLYVHGWQTGPESALRRMTELLSLMDAQRQGFAEHYPHLTGFRPWCVIVRWPSSSLPSLSGYRRIRDRAHSMSAQGTGHAPHVLAHLLGYLDRERTRPGPAVLRTRGGQYLHLVGHSFGGRFLCAAVSRAAAPHGPPVAGWSMLGASRHPFTVDSLLVFQMAAPRDCFGGHFPGLLPSADRTRPVSSAPLHGPIVLTYSRFDRATGFWHLRAEHAPGVGHSGVGAAPVPVSSIRLLPVGTAYHPAMLGHRLVSVDASWRFTGGRLSPARAHSDFAHPESAHLMLNLADLSR